MSNANKIFKLSMREARYFARIQYIFIMRNGRKFKDFKCEDGSIAIVEYDNEGNQMIVKHGLRTIYIPVAKSWL